MMPSRRECIVVIFAGAVVQVRVVVRSQWPTDRPKVPFFYASGMCATRADALAEGKEGVKRCDKPLERVAVVFKKP